MNPTITLSRLRLAGVLQGLLTVVAVFFLRLPILLFLRLHEVVDDPTIVTRQSDLSPSSVTNTLAGAGVVTGLIALALAATAGAICMLCLQRRRYRLCRKLCIIQCFCIPIGPATGALMLALLSHTAVQAAFDEGPPGASEA